MENELKIENELQMNIALPGIWYAAIETICVYVCIPFFQRKGSILFFIRFSDEKLYMGLQQPRIAFDYYQFHYFRFVQNCIVVAGKSH